MAHERIVHWRGDLPGEPGLPPESVWLINPEQDKFETPIDERGLILVPELIQAVKDMVDTTYQWPMHLSVHHFYWHSGWYDSAFAGPYAQKFRDLPIHKGLVPRVFENWLHKVTIEPDVPDPEVMELRVQGWNAAEHLFRSVRQAVVWEKRARRREARIRQNPGIVPAEFDGEDVFGKEILQDILNRHFVSVERAIEQHQRVPQEFRLVQLSEQWEVLGEQLGRLIMPKAMQLVRAIAA